MVANGKNIRAFSIHSWGFRSALKKYVNILKPAYKLLNVEICEWFLLSCFISSFRSTSEVTRELSLGIRSDIKGSNTLRHFLRRLLENSSQNK